MLEARSLINKIMIPNLHLVTNPSALSPFHLHGRTGSLSTEYYANLYPRICAENGIRGDSKKEDSLVVLILVLVENVGHPNLDFDHPGNIQVPFLLQLVWYSSWHNNIKFTKILRRYIF